MKMPFGKYKGLELVDVPRRYLQWIYKRYPMYGALEVEIAGILGYEVIDELEADAEKLERAGQWVEGYR